MNKSRRIFIILIVSSCLVGLVLYVFFNTSIVSRPLLRYVLLKNFKDYQVQSLTFHQQFIFPKTLVFRKMEGVLVSKQFSRKLYLIRWDQATVTRNSAKSFDIRVKDLGIRFEDLDLQGAALEVQLALEQNRFRKLKGTFFADRLKSPSYEFSNLWTSILAKPDGGLLKNISIKGYQGEFKGEIAWQRESSADSRLKLDFIGDHFVYKQNAKQYALDQPYLKVEVVLAKSKLKDLEGFLKIGQLVMSPVKISHWVSNLKGGEGTIQLTDINADVYEGKLTGQISLEYQPPFPYSMAMNIHKVNFEALQEINAAFFSQFEGHLDGQVLVAGEQNRVNTIQSDFSVPEGGKARAALVAYLLQYGLPPGTQQRELLDFLLSTDGKIPAEELSLSFQNVSSNKISGIYKIHSKQLNVDLNNSFDFNLDSDLVSLGQTAEQIKVGLMALMDPAHLKEGL